MSTTIDQRVVEMRFDNKHFESNVATTMSTLDKLKQKLHLDGATKGLDNVNNAAKNVKMDVLGNAVESVSAKFSALQVMGVTALANLTNSAVNAGKNIVKSLTIDPVKTGFSEYETKMGSIQTILANTEHQGTTLDDVTAALDELNTYADKTIYNFQQMTRNIGTFTAAGVDLNTSVRSIQGIANLAAVSGSTSQQASTAMYQLSQALAAGTVKLQDWNSVVNAGMGGKVFQNALIRTAAMLDGAASDVEAWQKKNVDAYGSFRNSLTEGAWLTTEVLTKTLEQFTMAAEEGTEEWEAYKKSLMDSGYSAEQAEEILKMANTATDAATKVKTFTQLLDTLKESAQSGWAQTWELIIGDFEEAKAFFTELSDIFGGILGESADRRNGLFGNALNSNWDKLIAKINEAGIQTVKFEESIRTIVGDDKLDGLIKEYGSLEKAVREGAISSDILKKALDSIAGTAADSKIASFVDGLKEIERTLRRGNIGDDVKKLQTALDELGYDLGAPGIDGIIGPITEKAIKAFQEANGLVADGIAGPETLAALEKAGNKLSNITGNVDDLKSSCDSLIDVITETSGRELLLDSLMNVIKAIQRPLAAVGEALRNIFSVSPEQLYNGLEKLNKFTKKLVPKGVLDADTWAQLTDNVKELGISTTEFELKIKDVLQSHGIDVDALIKKYGSLGNAFEEGAISFNYIKEALRSFGGISDALLEGGETVDKIRRSFEGLFAVLDIIATVLAGPIKFAFKIASKILEELGLSILDVTANIGDSIVAFRDKIDGVIETISTFIAEHVTVWIDKFRETEFFKTVAKWFTDASDSITGAIDGITSRLDNFNGSAFGQGLTTAFDFISDIADKVKSSKVFGFVVDTVSGALTRLKNFFTGFKMPEFNLDTLKNFFTNIVTVGDNMKLSGKTGLASVASGVWSTLKTKFVTPKWTTIQTNFEKFLMDFIDFWIQVGDKAKQAFEVCKDIGKKILEFLFGTEKINLPVIMDAVTKFLWIVTLLKTIQLLDTIVSPFDNITVALNNFATSLKWSAISSTFKSMALALGVLTVCIVILANIPDMKKAWQAAGMLAGLLVVMGLVVVGLGFLSAKMDGLDIWGVFAIAASLMLVVGAIALMARTLKEMDEFKLKHPLRTFVMLSGILLALTVGVKMIGKAAGSSFKAVTAILTLLGALKLMLEVIEAYDKFPWAGTSNGIQKMVEMMLALSLAMRIVAGGLKGDANFKGAALAIIAMVLSLKIMLSAIKDINELTEDELKKGIAVIGILMGLVTAFVAIANLTSKAWVVEKGQKGLTSFSGFAFALLGVVAAIWLLGKMAKDGTVLQDGAIALAQVLALMTLSLAVIGKTCSGLTTGPIIAALVAFVIIFAEVAIVISLMKDIPWQGALSAAAALSAVLLTLAFVVRSMSAVDVSGKALAKWITAIALLAAIVGGIAFVLYSMKSISWQTALSAGAALSIILGTMAAALLTLTKYEVSSGNIYKWVGAMALLTLIVGGLAFVLYNMQHMDFHQSMGNAIALSLLLGVMAGVLQVISNIHVTGDINRTIGALGVLGLVVIELGLILRLIDAMKIGNVMPQVLAISTLLVVLTGVMAACAALGVVVAGASATGGLWAAVGAIAVLGAVVLELGVFLHVIDQMKIGNVMPQVLAISALLAVLTGVMAACSALGVVVAGASATGGLWAAVGAIAVLGAVALELGVFLHIIDQMKIGDVMPQVLAISVLLVVLTGVMAACAGLGIAVAGAAATGGLWAAIGAIAVLGAVVLELGVFLHVIDQMKIGNVMPTVKALSAMLITLTAVLAVLTVLGFAAIPAIAGVSALIYMIESIGGLILAVGAIMSIPFLNDFLDTGIDALTRLARGIGDIISEFGAGLTSKLPEIGANLRGFIDNLNPFLAGMDSVGDDLIERVETLSSAILLLLAGEFLRILAGGMYGNLATLGSELTKFGENAGGFIDAMSKIKPEVGTGMESFCNALKTLNEANAENAWTEFWTGGSDTIGNFGENVKIFAESIKDAAESLKDITDDDVKNIQRAADAGQALADLNNSIPASGGNWQQWFGEKNLANWGTTISAFADSLIAYSTKVSGKNIDSKAIKTSAEAANAISDLNNSIPASGGNWQSWTGEQNLAVWGTRIVDFANSLVNYSAAVSGKNIDAEAITRSAEAATEIAKLNDAIPESDGFWQWMTGEKDLSTFGSGLTSLADGIVNYANAAVQIDETKIEAIKNTGTAVDEIKTVVKKIPPTGGIASWDGDHDPLAFGQGIAELANGIRRFCTVAATVDQEDIDAITFTKNAVTAISDVVKNIPEIDNMTTTVPLSTAASNLKGFCDDVNAISTAGYDFSGISTIKTAITDLKGVITGVEPKTLKSDMASLKEAAGSAKGVATTLTELNDNSYGGVAVLNNALKDLASADVDGVLATFGDKAGSVQAAVSSLVDAIVNSLGGETAISNVTSSMITLVDSAIGAAEDKTGEFETIGSGLASSLVAGLGSKNDDASGAGQSAGTSAASGARKNYSGMYTAGKYLGTGLVNGIQAKWRAAYNAGYTLGQMAVQGEKDGQNSASPSKETIKAGKWLGEGLIIGMERIGRAVYSAGKSMGQGAVGSISNSISRISSLVESGIDAQPTIRPVLDLSDVEAGTSALSGMLNMGSSVGVNANLGAITSMMNRRGQNGTNADVVSAIDKLNKKMDNLGNTTYQVNGITYDDGSNITDAVKTLVRAARIERRV